MNELSDNAGWAELKLRVLGAFIITVRTNAKTQATASQKPLLNFHDEHECFACLSAYTLRECGAHGSQERAPDPLKLELQVLVKCMSAGNQIWVLCKKSKGS